MAKWIQSGSVWRTDQFIPLLANGNYPHNGDVVMLTAILPFDNDAFVRAVGLRSRRWRRFRSTRWP